MLLRVLLSMSLLSAVQVLSDLQEVCNQFGSIYYCVYIGESCHPRKKFIVDKSMDDKLHSIVYCGMWLLIHAVLR